MRHWLFLVCAFILTAGCSSSVRVHVLGKPEMNKGGNAVVVKLYQLTAPGNFRTTPPSVFWQDDEGALGSELVTTPRKMTVYPAHTKTISLAIQDKTKYLGVAANLREPDREEWRSLFSLNKMGDEVAVTIEGNTIAVDFEERKIPGMEIGSLRR